MYCCEDLSKIENYELAVNDETQTWDIHHRGEILPCGIFTVHDLIDSGLYWNVPASHLIFLTREQHNKLHNANRTEDAKRKLADSNKGEKNGFYGKHHSEETKRLIGEKSKGRNIGRRHSEEEKRKISESHKGSKNPMFGKPSPNKGKHPSKETREKLSRQRKGRIPWNKGIKWPADKLLKKRETFKRNMESKNKESE